MDDRLRNCEENDGIASCACPIQYSGERCQDCATNYVRDQSETTTCRALTCSDISCQNNGTCSGEGSSLACTCLGEYSGDRCQISPCQDNPCKNEGECSVTDAGNAVCTCSDLFAGDTCTIPASELAIKQAIKSLKMSSNSVIKRDVTEFQSDLEQLGTEIESVLSSTKLSDCNIRELNGAANRANRALFLVSEKK